MNTIVVTLAGLVSLVDDTPAKEDVKAGWVAFGIVLAMAVAVVLLGWSLTRHLRKARRNADEGVFGPEDAARPVDEPVDNGSSSAS